MNITIALPKSDYVSNTVISLLIKMLLNLLWYLELYSCISEICFWNNLFMTPISSNVKHN